MIKEYKIDENKKREIENTQYKKHPKWKKNVWVLKTFDVIAIISPIIIIANYYIKFINVYWDLFDAIVYALGSIAMVMVF